MSRESLQTKIVDDGIGTHDDRITVKITATHRWKDDFEAVRDAVREALSNRVSNRMTRTDHTAAKIATFGAVTDQTESRWFPIDEYDLAYQHATGCKIGDERVDPEDEKSITITDFEGPVEVPIANV